MTRKTKRTIWISLAAFVLIVGGVVSYYFGSILNQLDGLQKKARTRHLPILKMWRK